MIAAPLRAETLDERHSDGFYLSRGISVVAVVGATNIASLFVEPKRPEPTSHEWLAIDDTVRGHRSTEADIASDVTLVTTLAVPFAANFATGFDTTTLNTSVIYAEVVAANYALNTAVKLTFPRLRPCNYDGITCGKSGGGQRKDDSLSFYSGHTSTAFAAALGGSYLFAAAHPDLAARSWLFGTETALATMTAIWRIRAGKHYYSDVAVGFLVGSAIGVGIPLLEGIRYRPSATEIAFAGGGVVVGGLVAVLAPFDVIVSPSRDLGVQILPSIGRNDVGIALNGRF
ncbi:MAG: phosphatase PAP2 family protein [Polyangiaceae bacterium]